MFFFTFDVFFSFLNPKERIYKSKLILITFLFKKYFFFDVQKYHLLSKNWVFLQNCD